MAEQVVDVAGTEVRLYQVAGLGGRWVFGGCRCAGGYATAEDAATEARLQLTGAYVGPLCRTPVSKSANAASVAVLRPLWNRR